MLPLILVLLAAFVTVRIVRLAVDPSARENAPAPVREVVRATATAP